MSWELDDIKNPKAKASALLQMGKTDVAREALKKFAPSPHISEEATKTNPRRHSWRGIATMTMEARGWRVHHTKDSRGSRRGEFDLRCYRERHIQIELKTKNRKLTPDQAEMKLILDAAGVENYVFYPTDWAEFIDVIF